MELVSEFKQELFVFIRLDCKKLRKKGVYETGFGLAKAGKLDISVFRQYSTTQLAKMIVYISFNI